MIKAGDRDRKLPVEGRDKDLQQQTQIGNSRGSMTHFKNHTQQKAALRLGIRDFTCGTAYKEVQKTVGGKEVLSLESSACLSKAGSQTRGLCGCRCYGWLH